MPEFPEAVVQATVSRRFFAVHLQVPRGAPTQRQIVFEEEEVSVVGPKVTRSAFGAVSGPLVAADAFPLLNPNTGAALGSTATHADLYRLLYSLYVDLAAKRDAAAAAPPPP